MDLQHIALNIYSFGYAAGFLKDDRYPDQKQAVTIDALPDLAASLGLGGIEFPFDYFFRDDVSAGVAFIKRVQARGLTVAIDFEKCDASLLRNVLPQLRTLDISWCRIKLPQTLYGGAQYKEHDFGIWRGRFIHLLQELLPLLRERDMRLLVENHQDLFIQDLIDVIRATDPRHIGINWDIGNSLAIGATPQQFYDALGPYIGNVHLKDYQIMPQEKGIGLVRCALGDGVVDFGSILGRIKKDHGAMPMSIELGAQVTRMVDMHEDAYWNQMIPVDRARRVVYEQFVAAHMATEQKTTLWQQRKAAEAIVDREHEEVKQSVDFLSSLNV